MKMTTIAKMLTVVAFAALTTTSVNAQSVKYPKVHFGVRLGGTYNSTTGSSDNKLEYGSQGGFTGGVNFDFQIARIPLYAETGIYYGNRTAHVKNGYDYQNHGVEIPILLSYHYYIADKVAVQPFAGIFTAYGKDFSYGPRIGCGINYGRFYANVGYDLDINEKSYEDEGREYGLFKCSGAFVTVGFNFCGKR